MSGTPRWVYSLVAAVLLGGVVPASAIGVSFFWPDGARVISLWITPVVMLVVLALLAHAAITFRQDQKRGRAARRARHEPR